MSQFIPRMPTAGPFLNDQKGAKESVGKGGSRRRKLHIPRVPLRGTLVRSAAAPFPSAPASLGCGRVPCSPFPTPIPLQTAKHRRRGPKWSPAKRVHLGEEEQGSGPNFRRQAEIEGSGLCDDDVPPIGSTPRGSSTAASVSTGGLRCHAAGAGDAGAPPQQWDPWPNSKAFSPDKTVPPTVYASIGPRPAWYTNQAAGR